MSITLSGDSYALPRDATETARLNKQHNHLLSAFEFHLHPAIAATLQAAVKGASNDLRIADVACGTGIWLREVSAQYLYAKCDGFDISGNQFPLKPDEIHGKVVYHVQDAADPNGFPPEFVAQFDVVAVRLLHVSLIGEQWDCAVRNLVALLKPGGWLQWIDWDPVSSRLVVNRRLANHDAVDAVIAGFRKWIKTRDTKATARIPEIMANEGLRYCVSEQYSNAPEMERSREFNENMIVGVLGLLGNVDPDIAAEHGEKAIREVNEGGWFIRFELWCHIGRKPT